MALILSSLSGQTKAKVSMALCTRMLYLHSFVNVEQMRFIVYNKY